MFGENNPSQVYMNNKKRYAEALGIGCKIINE
jgi:5,10-methylene-tetrahydrofolate dehydrogenase/methenyl tetrahydrofolate cyclohydrolase